MDVNGLLGVLVERTPPFFWCRNRGNGHQDDQPDVDGSSPSTVKGETLKPNRANHLRT